MSVQMQKSSGRSSSRQAVALSNGAVVDAAADPHIVQMAIAEAQSRAAERHSMIEQAAYYRAEKRGFQPGHELEDWLAAEEEVARCQYLTVMSPSSQPSSGSVS